jgi:hypothetical protein
MIDIKQIWKTKYHLMGNSEINKAVSAMVAPTFGSHAEAMIAMKKKGMGVDQINHASYKYFIEQPTLDKHRNIRYRRISRLVDILVFCQGPTQVEWSPCEDYVLASFLVHTLSLEFPDLVIFWNMCMAKRLNSQTQNPSYINIVQAGPREWTIACLVAFESRKEVNPKYPTDSIIFDWNTDEGKQNE